MAQLMPFSTFRCKVNTTTPNGEAAFTAVHTAKRKRRHRRRILTTPETTTAVC